MKKFVSMMMSLCMALVLSAALIVPADAASTISAGGDADSTVTLDAAAATFSVTVPTSLDMALAADGTVTCATTAKIVNNGYAPVSVTAIAVNDATGWTKVAFSNATTFKTYKVNSKQYAMKIGTTGNLQDANSTLTSAGGIIGTDINGGTELAFSYDGLISSFSAAQTDETVATVVFTVGWTPVE